MLAEHFPEVYQADKAAPQHEIEDFLREQTMADISAEDTYTLDEYLTVHELRTSLGELNRVKAPGWWFPLRVYQAYATVVTERLLEVLLELHRPKRRIAMGWMGTRHSVEALSVEDVLEWGVAEEQHMRISRTDEKVTED
ncbi:hypothetical protein NDU88_010803 [Pleurodeles waltl]|uniref:Uncharacterized protein n=1 Tax=Pleurodeles waltl TaxID=8319 RepID=A0AAV7S0P1_PLEWA|nr:hypothetical protein NDU88_010803 [Pleurodeles waltl]